MDAIGKIAVVNDRWHTDRRRSLHQIDAGHRRLEPTELFAVIPQPKQ